MGKVCQSMVVAVSIGANGRQELSLINDRFYTRLLGDRVSFPRENHPPKQTPGSAGRPAPEGACFDEASENQVVSGL
jgi:hypothetical protein